MTLECCHVLHDCTRDLLHHLVGGTVRRAAVRRAQSGRGRRCGRGRSRSRRADRTRDGEEADVDHSDRIRSVCDLLGHLPLSAGDSRGARHAVGTAALLRAFSTICVWITTAHSLPSPRVILVCHTMVLRPLCRAEHSARAVSPSGIAAKKLVLLSIVVVVSPSFKFVTVATAPIVSANAMVAPPCRTFRRLP